MYYGLHVPLITAISRARLSTSPLSQVSPLGHNSLSKHVQMAYLENFQCAPRHRSAPVYLLYAHLSATRAVQIFCFGQNAFTYPFIHSHARRGSGAFVAVIVSLIGLCTSFTLASMADGIRRVCVGQALDWISPHSEPCAPSTSAGDGFHMCVRTFFPVMRTLLLIQSVDASTAHTHTLTHRLWECVLYANICIKSFLSAECKRSILHVSAHTPAREPLFCVVVGAFIVPSIIFQNKFQLINGGRDRSGIACSRSGAAAACGNFK